MRPEGRTGAIPRTILSVMLLTAIRCYDRVIFLTYNICWINTAYWGCSLDRRLRISDSVKSWKFNSSVLLCRSGIISSVYPRQDFTDSTDLPSASNTNKQQRILYIWKKKFNTCIHWQKKNKTTTVQTGDADVRYDHKKYRARTFFTAALFTRHTRVYVIFFIFDGFFSRSTLNLRGGNSVFNRPS